MLPFRIIGGLKGRTFGTPLSPYRSTFPPNTERAILSIICDTELGEDQLIFPVSEQEAESYALREHHVDIPVNEWHNPMLSPLSIGAFFACRSPHIMRNGNANLQQPVADNDLDEIEIIEPVALFD